MVKSVEIANFRGFKSLQVSDLARINIIVGDNGVGKTALLEAIYLALCNNAQKPLSVRQWRGLDVAFQASSADSVVEGIYSDLFHDPDSDEPITIKLTGEGFENRKLVISKTRGEIMIPTEVVSAGNRHSRRAAKKAPVKVPALNQIVTAPISLVWTDEHGQEHPTRAKLSTLGLNFEGTGEKIPVCFMYAANNGVPLSELANNYSILQRRKDTGKFRQVFLKAFDQVLDLSVATIANSPVLLADVPWSKQLQPLPMVSGGTTRAASILLALANRMNGMVLVDEIEAGIYYARQAAFADALIQMSREYKSQLIMTTHSEEWLSNFLNALGEVAEDVAFWRLSRTTDMFTSLKRLSHAEFSAGFALGEMR